MTDIDPFDALPEPDAPRSGRRLLVGGILVIVIFAAFSVTAWFAYNRGFYSASDELAPVVRAEDGPTRVRPETPGGLDIPNQDKLVFDRIAPGQAEPTVERLLPEPEEPLPVNAGAGDEAAAVEDVIDAAEQQIADTADEAATVVTETAEAIEDAAETAAETDAEQIADAVPDLPAAPEEVADAGTDDGDTEGTLNLNDVLAAISEDLPGLNTDDPQPIEEPAEIAAVVVEPLLETPVEPPAPIVQAPEVVETLPTVESVAIPEPPTVETAAVTPPPPPVVPANGDSAWRVQLASVRDQGRAEEEWVRLQDRHPNLLGSLALLIQRADLDAGTFYRIQAGPVANRDAANKLCADLSSAKQDCLVVQP